MIKNFTCHPLFDCMFDVDPIIILQIKGLRYRVPIYLPPTSYWVLGLRFKPIWSDFRVHPFNYNVQHSHPHYLFLIDFTAQKLKFRNKESFLTICPQKLLPWVDPYPDRWAALTGCWRTSHSLCHDWAKEEMKATDPGDSHIWWRCPGKAVGPRAAAGDDFGGQSCQRLPSTEVRREKHIDEQGDPFPQKESFSRRTGERKPHFLCGKWAYLNLFHRSSQSDYNIIKCEDWK